MVSVLDTYSTVDQFLSTYNDITIMMGQGKTIDLIFFDFAKAFDTVCHSVLLSKLHCLGIDDELIDWIQYFLCNSQSGKSAKFGQDSW